MKLSNLQSAIFFLLVIVMSIVRPAAAQNNPEPVVFADTGNGIALYGLSANNELQEVARMPVDFGLYPTQAKWLVGPTVNLVLSPDSQKVAFTVVDNDYHNRLVVYSLDSGALQEGFNEQYGSYYFILDWSPDSQALLITPGRG